MVPPRQILVAIVDDDESVRRAIGRLLRSAGMEARVFASGSGFLADLGHFHPDCLVLDLHMPEISGFEVMARLTGRVPFVVITGQDSPEAEMRAFAAGAGAYLRKPFNDHALIQAIHAAITGSRPPAS